MKNQELQLTEGLFTIEAEERLETIQMVSDVAESCCVDGNESIGVTVGGVGVTVGGGGGGSTSNVDGGGNAQIL